MANTNVSLYNRIPAFPHQGNLWGLRPVEEQRVSACTSLCSLPPPPRSAHRHARELRLPQETRVPKRGSMFLEDALYSALASTGYSLSS